jgi:hypothetical protein
VFGRSGHPTWHSGVVCRAVVCITAGATLGCGQSPITQARIERALAPTFAKLVHHQVEWLDLPAVETDDLAVTASCRKLAEKNVGSGEWSCILDWKSPDRQTLRDTYDLFIGTDGCYMATVSGENLGGPTLKASDGRDVRNLLYAFDGCFDTTSLTDSGGDRQGVFTGSARSSSRPHGGPVADRTALRPTRSVAPRHAGCQGWTSEAPR